MTDKLDQSFWIHQSQLLIEGGLVWSDPRAFVRSQYLSGMCILFGNLVLVLEAGWEYILWPLTKMFMTRLLCLNWKTLTKYPRKHLCAPHLCLFVCLLVYLSCLCYRIKEALQKNPKKFWKSSLTMCLDYAIIHWVTSGARLNTFDWYLGVVKLLVVSSVDTLKCFLVVLLITGVGRPPLVGGNAGNDTDPSYFCAGPLPLPCPLLPTWPPASRVCPILRTQYSICLFLNYLGGAYIIWSWLLVWMTIRHGALGQEAAWGGGFGEQGAVLVCVPGPS